MPTSIPADVWICVAKLIPEDELRRMFSINGVFLQLAMDSRYRDVFLSTYNDITMKNMQRLREPAVAYRVRKLRVELDVRDSAELRRDKGRTWTLGISLDEAIRAIIDTVTHFTNVKEFSVEWYKPPDEELIAQFFTAAWNAFGSGLLKVTFELSLKHWPTVLSTTTGSLTELQSLDVNLTSTDDIVAAETATLVTALAKFVNQVAPTLRSLYLYSWRFQFELKPLFFQLETIPNLELFSIFVNAPHTTRHNFVDLHSLSQFLRHHATTIRRLFWSDRSPVYHLMNRNQSNNKDTQEQRTWDWLRKTGLVEVFSNLLELDVPVPHGPHNFPLILPFIRLSEQTLTSLTLEGSYIKVAEMNTLLRIFASPGQRGNLRKLSFCVECLSPEVIVLLALRLPRLEQLNIRYILMKVQSGVSQEAPRNIKEELVLAQKFCNAMKKFDIRAWPLRDINVIKRPDRFDNDFNIKLMMFLAECVPSVRTLLGHPKDFFAAIRF